MEASEELRSTTGMFSRSPFRSFVFLLASLLLVIAASYDFLIIADYGKQVGGHVRFWLVLVMVGLIGFWIRSILLHREIRKLYQGRAATETPPHSSIESVMRVAESIFNMGLFFTFFLSWALLAQILAILSKR
jgi:hypothetical protein